MNWFLRMLLLLCFPRSVVNKREMKFSYERENPDRAELKFNVQAIIG
jgi:hypothetical protein